MDPLSLSLGIAGIIPLVAKAIKHARGYLNAVMGAKKSIAALIAELEALQTNVFNLQELLKGDWLGDGDLRFGQTSVLLSCSTACEAKLRSLCASLGQEAHGGLMRRYLWPLSEKEHQKMIQELRSFTSWMRFALSIDGCRLLARTSDDVLRLMGQQLEQFRAVQSLEETAAQLRDSVGEQKKLLEDGAEREARRTVLDWISTSKHHRQRHHALQSSRARNTGGWILRRDEYTSWREGVAASNVLWCHGMQGSGKTNLASIIIDDLFESVSSPDSPVAYFYFDHHDQEAQSPSAVLSCILRQLVEARPEIPKTVADLHKSLKSQGQLPLHECERLIADVVRDSPSTYLVIDALDECDGSRHRPPLLQITSQLSRVSGLRLLVTSRPHIPDLTAVFGPHSQLKIEAKEEDLRLYLGQELELGGIYDVADDEFADRIVRKLSRGADGMFLLPVLQLRTVLKEPTVGEMEDRLEGLSQDLSEAFEETISRIRRLPQGRSRLGMGALMHLACGKRPFTAAELSDALAIHPGGRFVKTKYRPSTKVILECCQGLAMIDNENSTSHVEQIRVAHYAIQEYLVDNLGQLFPRAEAKLALNCLRYLVFEDFGDGPWQEELDIVKRIEMYPFLAYAAQNWGTHSRESEDDPEVWSTLFEFFGSAAATAVANQVRQYTKRYRHEYWDATECRSICPLHHASRHGLVRSIDRLLDQNAYQVNELTAMGSTPIIYAAANGYISTIRMLLKRGANPYRQNLYGNALHCAIETGQPGSIRTLVSWGMKTSEAMLVGCTLHRDAADAFETLVELGATLDAINPRASSSAIETDIQGEGLHAFHLACRWGCGRVADRILRRGWADVEMPSPWGRTGMHLAAMAEDPAALRVLIEAGADVNALDGEGATPLDVAEAAGNLAATRVLSEAGAVGAPV